MLTFETAFRWPLFQIHFGGKLLYYIHHTAAELIYETADADKPFMGLTTFEGELPTLKDTKIAKNYLTAEELKPWAKP